MAGRNGGNIYERQQPYQQQSAVEQMGQTFSNLISRLFEPIAPSEPSQHYPMQHGLGPRGAPSQPPIHNDGAAPSTGSGAGGYRQQSSAVPPAQNGSGYPLDMMAPGPGVSYPPPPRELSRSADYTGCIEQHALPSPNRGPQAAAHSPSAINRQASSPAPFGASASVSALRDAQRPSQSPTAARQRQPQQQPGRPAAQQSRNVPDARNVYTPDADDLIDQHVAYYFRHHPEVYKRMRISRKRPGVYELNGREIAVEWQYGLLPGEQGFLVALDGPLRQPFADYMAQKEDNAEYVTQGLSVNALHAVPLPARMTFDDSSNPYTRLEAMKVAKEQAIVREKAAEYAQMGMYPPNDLRNQYEKTINRKLNPGGRNHRGGGGAGPPMGMPQGGMPQPPPMGPGGFPMGPPMGPGGYPTGGPQMPMQGGPPGGNLFGNPDLMANMRGRSPGPSGGRPMFFR